MSYHGSMGLKLKLMAQPTYKRVWMSWNGFNSNIKIKKTQSKIIEIVWVISSLSVTVPVNT